ncbi:MAG TPA: class I SAM-dependent methyltransferase [Acidimicrobiia bacterium]|jgi:SAM-dependent methyltransferase|nr:class I SAM-dependent methyltransferase [Acidimicrobiia bacterium]
MVHSVAAGGFNDPADYEAARPSYPPEAVAWFVEHLDITPGRRVADLAAGTGKLTRLLLPTGADFLAVEPVPGMRATFRALLADIPLIAGTAEALPLAAESLDAITVAQAWHWFDHDRASAEAARVLRRGGRLGLVWNARDRAEPWVDEVWSIMDRVEKRAPWRDHENWRDSALVAPMPRFGPLHETEFRHVQRISPEGVVQRVASVSHVAVLAEPEREAVLDEVRTLLRTHPAVRGRDQVEIPYRVDCFWVERI